MPAPPKFVATTPELPAAADAVIIGGGIVGVFCSVLFGEARIEGSARLRKGRIGAEQSSRNWGWCRQQNRDARELPMATRASIYGRASPPKRRRYRLPPLRAFLFEQQ